MKRSRIDWRQVIIGGLILFGMNLWILLHPALSKDNIIITYITLSVIDLSYIFVVLLTAYRINKK
jgi:hypothetical protein